MVQKLDIVQCCLGRVNRELLEISEENPELKRFVVPTGVELINAAKKAGMITSAVNCCNGRVGKEEREELISILGGS